MNLKYCPGKFGYFSLYARRHRRHYRPTTTPPPTGMTIAEFFPFTTRLMPSLSNDDLIQQGLASLRVALTNLTFGSPYFSAVEQLQANHRAHECQDAGQLARWLVATVNELAHRSRAATQPPQPVATAAQRDLLRALLHLPTAPRAHKMRVLLALNRFTPAEAATEIRQLWALVGIDAAGARRDRRRAVAFQPAASLTYAALCQHNGHPDHA